jgi:ketosteroid isomerase-like protein
MNVIEQSENSDATERSEGCEQGPEQRSGTKFNERSSDRSPKELIERFYASFGKQDWKGMLDCYDEDITFYDPVFENLVNRQVKAMWEMLLTGAKDLEMSASNIESEDGYGSCNWVASYTFSRTGRKVVNRGTAYFKFSSGKITEHQDDFSFWKWSRQAFGISGFLFGWTAFLQNKVRRKARKGLEKFMAGPVPAAIPLRRD